MRALITISICVLVVGIALAEKPVFDTQDPVRIPCGLNNVIHDWDFAAGAQGFTTSTCDDQGLPVWQHGATTYVPGAPGDVWGTILEGDYPGQAGEALVSPAFTVTNQAYLMEIWHYYDAENLWDGGNVKVNGQVVEPEGGYPGIISVPSGWYSWCVDFESGFTGLNSGWLSACFDLSAFMGQTVQVSFEFGSDNLFNEAGWYLASVRIGNDDPVASQHRTWDAVKSLYR